MRSQLWVGFLTLNAFAHGGIPFTCAPKLVGTDYVLERGGCVCKGNQACDSLQLAYAHPLHLVATNAHDLDLTL
jgi:hypothetical protein